MTIFIRTQENDTVAEADVWVDSQDDHRFVEVSSSINILTYSKLLLGKENLEDAALMAHDMDAVSELRGWLWERYFMTKKNTPEELDDVRKEVEAMFRRIAEKHGLTVVVD